MVLAPLVAGLTACEAPPRVLIYGDSLTVESQGSGDWASILQGYAVDWTGDGVSIRYGLSPKIDADKVIRLARDDRDVRITPGGVVKLRIGDERADRITVASLALRKMVS